MRSTTEARRAHSLFFTAGFVTLPRNRLLQDEQQRRITAERCSAIRPLDESGQKLRPRLNLVRPVDMADVGVHGVDADAQMVSHLLLAISFQEVIENLKLARGQFVTSVLSHWQ